MKQRYFLIEPQYADPDAFCHFVVGSDRVRASIQIYANTSMLLGVVTALEADALKEESPPVDSMKGVIEEMIFDFQMSVMPQTGDRRILRFRVFQNQLDDGVPFQVDIRFELTLAEAAEFANELREWCHKKNYVFNWKSDLGKAFSP